MRRPIPLNAIRAFEAAARHLNFNRAAAELHVTPSAISHQVRALEEFLGVSLFRRLVRKVLLTSQGQEYLHAIRAALDQIASATEQIAADRARGPLTVNAAPAFATPWLAPRLVEFQLAHPEIEIRLTAAIELVDFSRSDVDVAIRYGLGRWTGLRSHRLFTEELIPVCSPELMRGARPLKRPRDLRGATLLHVLPRIGEWRMWLGVAGVTGVASEQGPKFHSTPLALDAAIAGQGVAIADRRLVAEHLKQKRLIAPFDITLPSDSAYYLVYPEECADHPKIAAFREWLLAEVAVGPHALTPMSDG